MIAKACPVLVETRRGRPHILVFRHPLAGVQLVKGTIEAGETPPEAALRELAEEASIQNARVIRSVGVSEIGGQLWHFVQVAAPGLAETWTFRCADDSGHDFAFFWHPLAEDAGEDWHPVFRQALVFIRAADDRPGRNA